MEGVTKPWTYRPIDAEHKEIRLVTIEPSRSEDGSDIVRLDMHHYPLNEDYFIHAWREWTRDRAGTDVAESRWEWWEITSGMSANPNAAASRSMADLEYVGLIHETINPFRYTWGDYLCLSYNWGSLDDAVEVVVNGDRVRIGPNLEAALRAIRGLVMIKAGLKLWVDALCIDQANLFERAEQVGRMKDIYSGALDVIVWLGVGSTDTAIAFDFVKALTGVWEQPEEVIERRLEEVLHQTPVSIGPAFGEVGRMRYFNRTWVLQELHSGTSKMPVLCGDRIVLWIDLCSMIQALYPPLAPDRGMLMERVLERFPSHLLELRKVTGDFYFYFERVADLAALKENQSFWNTAGLFSYTRPKGAVDPRDKVYGLLGLMNRDLARDIHLDYGASAQKVFQAFAKSWITTVEDLDVLGQCDHNDEPSWVPHLDRVPYRHWVRAYDPKFAASEGTKPQVRFLEDDTQIACRGVLIDAIDGLTSIYKQSPDGQVPPPGPIDKSVMSTNIKYWNEQLPASADVVFPPRHASNAYGGDAEEGVQEALWRALLSSGSIRDGRPKDTQDGVVAAAFVLTFPEFAPWLAKNGSFPIAGVPLRTHFERLRARGEVPDEHLYNRYVQACRVHIWTRRLMVTEKGYVGLVSEAARPGDVVAVLWGCTFPVLLRQVEKDPPRYRFLSPTFVQGWMDGEAIRGVEEGKLSPEEIIII